MTKKEINTAINNLEKSLKGIKKNDFRAMFFVPDSKGMPIGLLSYVYNIAYNMKEMGYNVNMLYASTEDFVGVGDWLGEKYALLPHFNTVKDKVEINPQDILFIPEILPDVMARVRKVPCKKVAVIESLAYMVDTFVYGASLATLGIDECITTSERFAAKIKSYFPYVKTHVIRPCIDDIFKDEGGNRLMVNIVSKDQNEINRIIKPFKWLYPDLGFVTFRYIGRQPHSKMAKLMNESCVTVWIDEVSAFGFSPLEAMACGSIVIAKVPELEPEWMISDDGKMKDNGIWVYNTDQVINAIASVVRALLYDYKPESLSEEMEKTVSYYRNEHQIEDIKAVISVISNERTEELKAMIEDLNNRIKDAEE